MGNHIFSILPDFVSMDDIVKIELPYFKVYRANVQFKMDLTL